MNKLNLELELVTDLVLTSQSATAGAPRSLDHIPGAVLLGACAARLYPSLSEDESWLAFHSGKVRFGDGLPLTAAGTCLPMPLAFHQLKNEPWLLEGHLAPDVRNGSRSVLQAGRPWKQLRGGFVAPDLRVVRPEHRQAQRTALASGRARDGFLYSLDALVAGAVYRAEIAFDDEVPVGLRSRIRGALADGELRLGRSRGAEFGRVRAHLAEPVEEPWLAPGGGAALLLLLAVSDLALREPRSGSPCLEPSPCAMGLPAGAFSWLPGRSYLHTRRYSPFNAKRRRPDLERQVIQAGSVIAVKPGDGWNTQRLAVALARGVGDHRQDGLGQILVEPPLLGAVTPRASVKPVPAGPLPEPRLPDDDTAHWLERAWRRKRASDKALDDALAWTAELVRWQPALPASQWGEVRGLAAMAESRDSLVSTLFEKNVGFTETGVGKLEQRWGARFRGESRRDALQRLISAAPQETALESVQLLAVHLVRRRRGKEVTG